MDFVLKMISYILVGDILGKMWDGRIINIDPAISGGMLVDNVVVEKETKHESP